MTTLTDKAADEPVVTGQIGAATVTAFVGAVLAVLRAAGVPISDELHLALTGLVAVVAPFVAAALARRKVTPLSKL